MEGDWYRLVMIGDEIGVADVAAGIGVLFAARGIGSGLGPIVARAVLRERAGGRSILVD